MPLVSDQVRLAAERFPDVDAYEVVGVGTLSMSGWDQGASRAARRLIDEGLRAQERVAICCSPGDALVHLQAYMGVHKAGGVTVPTNVRLSTRELAHIFGHSEPRVVVASDELLPRVREAAQGVASIQRIVAVSEWDDWVADDDEDVQVALPDDAMADLLYTSGTTGRPKGVVARHNRATQMPIGPPDAWTGLKWFHASPLFTFAGISFITVPPRMGTTGLYLPRFDAGEWLRLAEEEPVLMGFLVPSMVELIVNHPDWGVRDLSSIAMISIGSAPIAPATLYRFAEGLPNAAVSNSYSMTEAGAAFCVMPKGELHNRPGSVGQPIPPLEIRIVDEAGDDVATGDVGEVVIRNPGREREYFNDDEATAETWQDGWLHSGDLGRFDEDGFLYIVGRMKDVIIRGGNNIYCQDIEHVLYEHPNVQEAAVVGVPHDVLGEDVGAAIVAVDGAALTADDIAEWCEERLADYKRPRHVRIVDELPRNAMGKVLKRELVKDF